jgi:hypothetical protein
MASIEGYVTVFESSDGGTGVPEMTLWQFFVDPGTSPVIPVTTKNQRMAETVRFAIETNNRVRITYNDGAGNPMTQARIAFKYVCESLKIDPCRPPLPGEAMICATQRYSVCDPNLLPKSN